MTSLPGSVSSTGAGSDPRQALSAPLPHTIVLSCFHAGPLLHARGQGLARTSTSLDLGLTSCEVGLSGEGVILPGGDTLPWEEVEAVADDELACFEVHDAQAFPIRRFSEELNRSYGLMPTRGAPTLLVSGIPMHRIQGTDPLRDTYAKVRTVAPMLGHVLDTCTGLGYTAIQSARTAEQVVTIELDPQVLEVARLNPWSAGLFGDPHIVQIVGDAYDVVATLEDGRFSRIVHDPPTFSLAGDLYSGAFYRELWRVLRRGGRLFHYIGDLNSRSGHGVARGVVRRLQEAGFSQVIRRPEAFGVVASKVA
ncbi:MAG TPA: methyltransferase domain-containing protein [Anaerolineae bacterium]|nr:methyltransferase domain-containing protein [Anaerolineae bacterium]